MNSQPIQFYHRGQIMQVDNAPPTLTVLDWLREHQHCTGTKEGCNEGDCGACTVVVGELTPNRDGLALKNVNACIKFFFHTLQGSALFTVEDLTGMAAGQLHPVQQAMVDCHGSQCGFCTPGFVMSLWACYEHHQAHQTRPHRSDLADALAGNLCRCTGYQPILQAGSAMFDALPCRLDTAPSVSALNEILDQTATPGARQTITGDAQAASFYTPRTVDELAALRLAHPKARLLAGGTDVGLWVNKQFRELGDIIYLGKVQSLQRISMEQDALYIGAGASLEDAWSALAAEVPSLKEVWLRFASPPIRHAGTMGGNLANGSPIGDAAPILMALDARVELRQGSRVRQLALHEFYLGYMQNRMEDGEWIQGIVIPRSSLARDIRAYKISKRFDSDISAVCAGLSLTLQGNTVTDIRLAFGGMAAKVKRAALAESVLVGQDWSQTNLGHAKAALARDFQPLSDMRASSDYRLQVAQNLLQRFWLETRTENPLPAAACSVWADELHQPTTGGRP